MWKIGVSGGSFEPNDENFKDLKESGISAVEVGASSWAGKYKEAKELSDKYGIELWSMHLPFAPFDKIDISSTDEELRSNTVKTFCGMIKEAAAIGIDKVVVHPSGEPISDEEREDRIKSAMRSLDELCEFASEYGIAVAVEDLPRTCLGNTIENMERLLSANDKLRVCFDTNHLLTDDNIEFLERFAPKIITVHISDFDYINERHWLPGEGKIDWERLVLKFKEIGYKGVWLYELGRKCPKTILRPRDLEFKDYYRNACELYENKPLTVLGTPKENLGMWE